MPDISVQLVVFLLFVGAYTIAAAIWDIRIKKIPNKLTLPVFALGIIYQASFNHWSGLADGALGFLAGFGLLFVLWMIGSGGGGDVKLMGGLSVWLGLDLTLYVLVVSTVMASVGTFGIVVYSMFSKGVYRTKDKYTVAGRSKDKKTKDKKETVEERVQRRPMGYAVPVALATWAIVAWKLPTFPWMDEAPAQADQAAVQQADDAE